MPVAEFEENSLRFAKDHKGLHKTFRSQKRTILGNFSSWLTRHLSSVVAPSGLNYIIQRGRKHRL